MVVFKLQFGVSEALSKTFETQLLKQRIALLLVEFETMITTQKTA